MGRWGQDYCERFLKKGGYSIIARNFSCKTGEIDLVVTSPSSSVVFVEVKTRADENFAPAESAITSEKKRRLIRTARYFVQQYRLDDVPLRFDVVIVLLGQKGRPQIRHYENAFAP